MKKIVLAAVAALVGVSAANAAVFTFSGPTAGGIDGSSVQNYDFDVVADGLIDSLSFSLTTGGAFGDDVTFSLSHLGTTVTFYNGHGDTYNSQIDATFSDSATDSAPYNGSVIGTYLPANPFAAFTGLAAAGTYTLSTVDFIVPGDGTSLDASSLTINTSDVPEPASWAMMVGGFGLLGGALRRKKATVSFA